MARKLSFALITLFWITMNALLWRAEFAGKEVGAEVPVSLIWQKILTSPDDSGLAVHEIMDARKFGDAGKQVLIEEFLGSAKLPAPPTYFGIGTWETFLYAIEYRNVLTHECTYLGQDRSPALIEACQVVLHKLAAAAGLKPADA